MNKKIKITIVVIVALAVAYSIYYLTDCSHAESTATDYLNGTDDVNVTKIDKGLYLDGYGNDTALIFYPGAKIEYISYLPMLFRFRCNLPTLVTLKRRSKQLNNIFSYLKQFLF